ncbi:MAG: S1C family serine protease [Halodesulfurarchaeum sp.]
MRPLVPFVLFSLVVGLVVGGAIGMALVSPDETIPPTLDAPGTGSQDGATRTASSNFTELYHATSDSVVKLRVSTTQGPAQGSGFVYDDAHIVTNEHVVGDADSVFVQFSDGSWHTGQVVGTDVYTDLAVLRVSDMPEAATPLPVARTDPTPGQTVVAIGSPFGLEGTITHGIVSGVNRSMAVEGGFSIPDTVQTDAPINPGNSGGPLVAMDGRVVGVNRAKEGDNIGFAISAAVVRQIVPELIDDGRYAHSYLGIRTFPVTPQMADSRGMDEAKGLVVVETVGGTPAAEAFQTGEVVETETGQAVRGGDVIVGIEGRPIHTSQDLSRHLLLHTRPGESISISVVRDGTREQVQVELVERPETP